MRLCQLISSYERSTSLFVGIDPYPDALRWLPEHDRTTCFVHKDTAAATVDELVRRGYDAFINLCDGEPDEDIAGIEVVERLEWHGVAFTGADARNVRQSSSRQALKQICRAAGIDTPAGAFLGPSPPYAGSAALLGLRFPLLVKPPGGYASIGIERTSRVEDEAALARECARVQARFGGALVEEFKDGPEFTVLVAEPAPGESTPLVYPPQEIGFPAGETFKHFDLKWRDFRGLTQRPVADATLDLQLRQVAQRYFVAAAAVSYLRCDIRLDAAGRPFLLDGNAAPGVFYPPGQYGCADLILAQEPEGHRRFLEHLLRCARHRAERRGRPGR